MDTKPTTETKATMHVRGNVNLEKFKAARTLGCNQVKFELRAVRPGSAIGHGPSSTSCIVCLICIICIVCTIATANELGLPQLPPL